MSSAKHAQHVFGAAVFYSSGIFRPYNTLRIAILPDMRSNGQYITLSASVCFAITQRRTRELSKGQRLPWSPFTHRVAGCRRVHGAVSVTRALLTQVLGVIAAVVRTEGARDTLGAPWTGSVARRRACARVGRRAVTGGAVTVTVAPTTE